MITIIGTSHIDSKEKIEGIIKDYNPEVLGVELCNLRINEALSTAPVVTNDNDKSIIGKISTAIRKKAQSQGVDYGSDMKTVARYAFNNHIPLVPVDQDITIISSLMQKIPQVELQGFMTELASFEHESLSDKVDGDEVLEQLRTRYPISYEFLITLREYHIINSILKMIISYPDKRILVFVGKGHELRIKNNLGL